MKSDATETLAMRLGGPHGQYLVGPSGDVALCSLFALLDHSWRRNLPAEELSEFLRLNTVVGQVPHDQVSFGDFWFGYVLWASEPDSKCPGH